MSFPRNERGFGSRVAASRGGSAVGPKPNGKALVRVVRIWGMTGQHSEGGRARRALDPIDRFSEILFGTIMVLTFTCSISVAESGREEIRTMLFASIGCNLAWGIVDGVMYLLTRMSER